MLSGTVWGVIAKIFDALAKFVTIPMLVGYFGKADYGLIALTFSLNAYLRLMDMGMNIGSIRFFSIWISEKSWDKISQVSRSSVVFYGVIGIINSLIFLLMAEYAGDFFKLELHQQPVFKWMMYILSASTVFNWVSSVVNQLLNAYGEQGWINRVTVISSFFNFVTAFVAVKLHLSLPIYFVLYTLSTLMVIPLNVYRLRIYKMPLLSLLWPKWNGKAFKEILGYSLAIFVMGIFQFSADSLRPILLGKYASGGISVLTEYRVIQTMAMLVIAFGGVFMQVLLPSAAKVFMEGDKRRLEVMVFDGTKYITIFLSFVVFLLIVNADIILNLYMGEEYSHLEIWLVAWLLTVLITMHNAPVASIVLASGKTKKLAYSSAFSCLLSLPITAILAHKYNVGAAVIGFFVYVCMQASVYYVYYIPNILLLNGYKIIMTSFFPSVLVALIAAAVTKTFSFFNPYVENAYLILIVNSLLFSVLFITMLLGFVVKKEELAQLRNKVLKKSAL